MAGEEIIPGVGDVGTAVADSPADDAAVVDAGGGAAETVEETSAAETPEAGDTGGDAEAAKAEDDLSDIETDGRKIDAATRKDIAELKKTNPAAAKKWAESYFRTQAVMKEFPEAKNISEVISQVRQAKATIESLGGEQGIQELQGEVADYREEIAQFAAGDVKLLEKLYDANPEATVTQAQNLMGLLEAKDMKAFDQALLPSLAKRLETSGLTRSVDNLIALVKKGDGQAAYDLLGEVKKWLGGIADKAKEFGSSKPRDPREDVIAEREKALETKERESYERAIGSEVNKSNNSALSRVTADLFKELKLDNEGKREFIGALQSRVWAAMKADKGFQRLAHALKSKGDAEKTAKFVAAKFEELLPSQFERLRNAMYPNIGRTAKPTPKPNGAQQKVAPITVQAGQRPKHDQVDWSKTTDMMWATGRAYLRDGKLVTGFKDAPPNRL
jgi:hypothetical protein